MQALSTHIEWMLPPAIQLHRCLLGLVQPAVLAGPLAEMRCVMDISPLERASAISQHVFLEAKNRTPELEASRLVPTSVHAVRGWIRQCKELVRPCSTLAALRRCCGGTTGLLRCVVDRRTSAWPHRLWPRLRRSQQSCVVLHVYAYVDVRCTGFLRSTLYCEVPDACAAKHALAAC